MPWLDVSVAYCNCAHHPKVGLLAVRRDSGASHEATISTSEDENSDSPEENCSCSEKPILFTEYFKLKGSTYHEHFQKALKSCKKTVLEKRNFPMKLALEPINKKDENAIVVLVKLDCTWQPVGYIPGGKVKKAMNAMQNEEIRTIQFKSIEWRYIWGLGEFRYIGTIVVTKENKWLPTDNSYSYNDMI